MPTETLIVFPNTGHQYFTIELMKLWPEKGEAWWVKFVNDHGGPFRPWERGFDWIRYQYQLTPRDNKPVLKLVVETNLGLPSRGFLYDVEESAEKPKDEDSANLYAATEDSFLDEYWRSEEGIPRTVDLTNLPVPSKQEGPLSFKNAQHYPSEYLPLPKAKEGQTRVQIFFERPPGEEPVDVDLIVDLGNARTTAVLLEDAGPGPDYKDIHKRIFPLRVLARGAEYTRKAVVASKNAAGKVSSTSDDFSDCEVFSSWLLLHRPLFAHLEPPLTDDFIYQEFDTFEAKDQKRTKFRAKRYLPQAFVELSPALIGGGKSLDGASKVYARIRIETHNRFYLSSPKRYVWDDANLGAKGVGGSWWKQIPNLTDPPEPGYFTDLSGMFRYFMSPDALDWNIDSPPDPEHFTEVPFLNTPPVYPRRDAVCWFALSLLEAAYRQMNSRGYRERTERSNLPRRLRNIRVTYPSGWTYEERVRYFEQWERAIKLFAMTHLADPRVRELGGDRPAFQRQHLDEAVCSQLPILYAQIQSLANSASEWIRLYGNEDRVVVMNVDIGGGTTDLAIIEYKQRQQNSAADDQISVPVELESRLLFRDGHAIAGDMVVKRIIEKVLIPSWARGAEWTRQPWGRDALACLQSLFDAPTSPDMKDIDPFAKQKMIRIIRLILVPLANELLQRLGQAGEAGNTPWEPLDIKTCVSAEVIDGNTLDDLNDLCGRIVQTRIPEAGAWRGKIFPVDARFMCDPKEIESCIDEVFSKFFVSLGQLASHYKCHLLIASGKPSELPRVRQLMLQSFALLPQRIIQLKNFPAGGWYPFAVDGKVKDAKTCTVVGAALFQDICNKDLENFTIRNQTKENADPRKCPSYWGIMPPGGHPTDFYRPRMEAREGAAPQELERCERGYLLFSPPDYRRGQADTTSYEKNFVLSMNCRLGRQIVKMGDVRPAPVYKLDWRPLIDEGIGDAKAIVTLRWVFVPGEGDKLELVNVTPIPGQIPVQMSEVRLKLNTLPEESFWLDEPSLKMEFENQAAR